jgi:hypothetical protein
MLSAGFATTTYLRSRLMPDEASGETEWDAAVAALGNSVAAKFDRHCNRAFARAVNHVDRFSARAAAWVLTRFPVETITTVELLDADGTAEPIAAGDWWIDGAPGLLETDFIAGNERQKIRIVYTGGYWLDPRDGTVMPVGATPLPADVLEAWVLQCQHDAETRGLFHAVSFRRQADESAPKTIDAGLLEATIQTLRPFRRFAGN